MTATVNHPAPAFTAQAVMSDGSTQEVSLDDYKGQTVVLFFYPKDFTFVCPSEIIAFDHRLGEFEKRGAQVLGVSIDDAESHANWRNTAVEEGGIGSVGYPLLCDEDRAMTNAYGLLHEDTTFALRGTFLIDGDGVLQSATVNNLPIGRDIDETLRLLDAMAHAATGAGVCPAGWNPSKPDMQPTAEGVASYLAENAGSL
ncbi:MAG TPA: alkyl hydroperoxide reductase [Planctomycetes bacterium]|nr:alkyl hydroperoxide reductase [Planctomycetota bacterium]